MTTRYSGSIAVRLTVDDHGVYTGTVKASGMKAWPFRLRASPDAARRLASDSKAMYTLMAKSAIGFALHETDAWFQVGNFTADGEAIVSVSNGKRHDPAKTEENPGKRFINSPDDMKWLRDVHGIKAKSAVIIGNEDAPDIIEAYSTKTPSVYDKHRNFTRDDSTGKMIPSIPIGF